MDDVQDQELSYEAKIYMVDEILTRLDHQETPIDELAVDVKLGARLIKELEAKLRQVELAVLDAFRELESE